MLSVVSLGTTILDKLGRKVYFALWIQRDSVHHGRKYMAEFLATVVYGRDS